MSSHAHLAARGLALLLLALAPAAPRAAEPPRSPAAVETDDEALKDIQRAVKARDAEALLSRVGGVGVEGGTDRLVSPGWLKKQLTGPPSELQGWVFGPRTAPRGMKVPFTMAECLAGKVSLVRTGSDTAEVTCSSGINRAAFGLTRHQGRWAITRDFFWPNELVRQ